jgi:hypothetical protein
MHFVYGLITLFAGIGVYATVAWCRSQRGYGSSFASLMRPWGGIFNS